MNVLRPDVWRRVDAQCCGPPGPALNACPQIAVGSAAGDRDDNSAPPRGPLKILTSGTSPVAAALF